MFSNLAKLICQTMGIPLSNYRQKNLRDMLTQIASAPTPLTMEKPPEPSQPQEWHFEDRLVTTTIPPGHANEVMQPQPNPHHPSKLHQNKQR